MDSRIVETWLAFRKICGNGLEAPNTVYDPPLTIYEIVFAGEGEGCSATFLIFVFCFS